MIPKYLHFVVAPVFLLTLVTLTLVANIVQLITWPLFLVAPEIAFTLNGRLAGGLWRLCQFYFNFICGAQVDLKIDKEIKANQNALVISNHRFFGDFFLLHAFALKCGMLDHCKYFAKESIKYMPVFGWGIYMMGCIMVRRDWAKDRDNIRKTFQSYLDLTIPVWIISYVEGTRYTPSKSAQSREYAAANGLQPLKHLLLPRTKGFASAVECFRNSARIQSVYNVVLVYYHPKRGFGATPKFTDFLFGRLNEFTYQLHVSKYKIDDIPNDYKDLSKWLNNLYVQNDQLLQKLESKMAK